MTRPRRPKRPAAGPVVPRTARLNELIREIVAEELERLGDERLEHVAITAVDVDADLNRAIVYFDSWVGPEGDDRILTAFGDRRIKLQSAVGRQMRARKTPILEFRPDDVIRYAEHIERVIRDNPVPERPDGYGDGDRPA
jgi:ribosome-binding factor A